MDTPKTILIIDEDSEVVEIFCDTVHEINPGAVCVRVKEGNDAFMLLLAGSIKPDLVFTNDKTALHGQDSWLEQAGKKNLLHRNKVIVYTVCSDREDLPVVNAPGISIYLVKPFKISDLKPRLTSLLKPQEQPLSPGL